MRALCIVRLTLTAVLLCICAESRSTRSPTTLCQTCPSSCRVSHGHVACPRTHHALTYAPSLSKWLTGCMCVNVFARVSQVCCVQHCLCPPSLALPSQHSSHVHTFRSVMPREGHTVYTSVAAALAEYKLGRVAHLQNTTGLARSRSCVYHGCAVQDDVLLRALRFLDTVIQRDYAHKVMATAHASCLQAVSRV